MICVERAPREDGVEGGERSTGRFAPGVSKAEEGMGGTGGGAFGDWGGGGGEWERVRRVYAIEGERRCERLRGVLPGEEKVEDAGDASGESQCAWRVPNSSPSNQSCCCTLVLMVEGWWLSFSSRGEPTRRGGIGGSLRFGGNWRREREEMRRGKAGREGRGDGTRGGEGMRGGGTQRDMQVQHRAGGVGAGSLEQRRGRQSWQESVGGGGRRGRRIYRRRREETKEGCSLGCETRCEGTPRGVALPKQPSDSDAHPARCGHASISDYIRNASNKRRQRMLRSRHTHLAALRPRPVYHPPADSLDCAQGAPSERILRGRGQARTRRVAPTAGSVYGRCPR